MPLERNYLKTLETIVAMISWLVMALVIYALAPLLIKIINLGQGIHDWFK